MDMIIIPLQLEEIKVISCPYCHKEVEVKLIPYGDGRIAVCPACNELAYNRK